MAVNKMMVRDFAGIEFQQDTMGMINITPLFENQVQLIESMCEKVKPGIPVLAKDMVIKRLAHYMEEPKTKDLLKRLAETDNLTQKEVKRTSRAKASVGTFVHPVVVVDAMSWLSVDFKIWANKLVMDELIKYRNMTAQSNKEIAKAFDEAGFITQPAYEYGTINIAIGDACDCAYEQNGYSKRYLWEHASKEQLIIREKIQMMISGGILLGNITSFGAGITAIKTLGNKLK
jgi:hypothetical protein